MHVRLQPHGRWVIEYSINMSHSIFHSGIPSASGGLLWGSACIGACLNSATWSHVTPMCGHVWWSWWHCRFTCDELLTSQRGKGPEKSGHHGSFWCPTQTLPLLEKKEDQVGGAPHFQQRVFYKSSLDLGFSPSTFTAWLFVLQKHLGLNFKEAWEQS